MRKIIKYVLILFVILLIILVIGRILIDKEIKEVQKLTKEVYTDSRVLSKSLDYRELKTQCPKLDKLLINSPENFINLARNRHFEKDGHVYRIRTFIEDTENGSYTKLVLYKEDQDGFPRIQKIPAGKEVNPTEEYISSFLKGAKVIHLEEDHRVLLNDGREITYSSVNGKIVKLNSEQDDCIIKK